MPQFGRIFLPLIIMTSFDSLMASQLEKTTRYIVVLKKSATLSGGLTQALRGMGSSHLKVIRSTSKLLKTVTIATTQAQIKELRRIHDVAYIVKDGVASIQSNMRSMSMDSSDHWNLDRLDQTLSGGHDDQIYRYTYTGNGVNAYVVDTGVSAHPEFGNRLKKGVSFVEDEEDDSSDCNGHGTHVAGTLGGQTAGVAKGVSIHPVRVFDCGGSGRWSAVIAGLEWIRENAIKPAVVNFSLGGIKNQAVNDALRALVESGVTVVGAAGNRGSDACYHSPASEPAVITVGNTTYDNTLYASSSYGKCVDIQAPGSEILAADHWGELTLKTGTSMAAPHVAGAAAILLEALPQAKPQTVKNHILANALRDQLTGLPDDTDNLLLQTAGYNKIRLHSLVLNRVSLTLKYRLANGGHVKQKISYGVNDLVIPFYSEQLRLSYRVLPGVWRIYSFDIWSIPEELKYVLNIMY